MTIKLASQISMNKPATLPKHVATLADLANVDSGGGDAESGPTTIPVWVNTGKYPDDSGGLVVGSDDNIYCSTAPSGPGTSNGAVDPTTDTQRIAWVKLVEDAPNDGKVYVRKNDSWVQYIPF